MAPFPGGVQNGELDRRPLEQRRPHPVVVPDVAGAQLAAEGSLRPILSGMTAPGSAQSARVGSRIPAWPVQWARLSRTIRVPWSSGPRTRSQMGSSAANWSRAPAASPACPVQRARLLRAARVSWCSGPRTRSVMGSSAASWSRAAAAFPASPVQWARP